jgi:hypothetical protein
MAIDLGSETPTLATSDRSWRIEIFIDDTDTVQLVFHREKIFKTGGNIVHRKVLPSVNRTQAQIAAKSYTAAGATRTGNQILALVNKMADDERQVDIDNPGA